MIKLISRSGKALVIAALVVSVGLYYLACEQWPAANAITKRAYCITGNLSSTSTMSAAVPSNDTNWAGYIVASDLQNPQATVTSISASWTVPAVAVSPQDTLSAVWIGIGGFFDETLIQTGTEQDSIQGQSIYSAWVELLPRNSVAIDSITVSPGDQINASIQLIDPNTDQWSINIKDLTTNQEYSKSFFYTSSQLSAEWIIERPDISSTRSRGTLSALADIGQVKFTDCQATIGDKTGAISSFPTVQSIMYQHVQAATNSGITQLAAISDLTGNGSSFIVETSPSAISELPALILLPLIIGVSLLATAVKKHMHTSKWWAHAG